MELEKDEKMILREPIGFRENLILTNKRLIVVKKKGLFGSGEKISDEIYLSEIEEAYTDYAAFGGYRLKLILKGGWEEEFQFRPGQVAGFLSGQVGMDGSMKAKSDRWVNAINKYKKEE